MKVTFPPDDAVTNQSLKRIVDIEPVSELTFDSVTLGKPHLDLIERSPELMSLTLNQCRFDPVALRPFELPPQIRSVNLVAMPLDESITEKLANVESLGLSECTVDDAMVDAVSQLGVRILALSEIEFTQRSFKNLLSAPQLGYVTLAQCEFDLEWVRDLKTRRPALNIQAQPKAFLGIGQAGEDSCLIARVIGGSGAERAGVKIGDLMLSIDGQEVKRFEEVRLLIAQKRVDQKVKIIVARDGKTAGTGRYPRRAGRQYPLVPRTLRRCERQPIKRASGYRRHHHQPRRDAAPSTMPRGMLMQTLMVIMPIGSPNQHRPHDRRRDGKAKMDQQHPVDRAGIIERRRHGQLTPVDEKSHFDLKCHNGDQQNDRQRRLDSAVQIISFGKTDDADRNEHHQHQSEHGQKNRVQHQRRASWQESVMHRLGSFLGMSRPHLGDSGANR